MKWIAALVIAIALAGCGSAPAPPVSQAELTDIVTSFRDIAWQDSSYSTEDPPDLGDDESTLADAAWLDAVSSCFGASGYRMQQVGDRFVYESGGNGDYREYALARYRCLNAHPRLSTLAAVIDDDAHASLVRYIDDTVRPCLALAGHPTESSAEAEYYGSFTNLDPFALLDVPDNERALLTSRCPPVPEWLSLA